MVNDLDIKRISVKSKPSEISYSLIPFQRNNSMKVDGSKIIFGLGVFGAVATAVVALYFSIR